MIRSSALGPIVIDGEDARRFNEKLGQPAPQAAHDSASRGKCLIAAYLARCPMCFKGHDPASPSCNDLRCVVRWNETQGDAA